LFFFCFNPEILATASFFPIGLHDRTLEGEKADTLDHLNEIKGELVVVWGRQDTNTQDRVGIYKTLQGSKVKFSWFETNANHAFLLDDAPDQAYDPSVSHLSYDIIFDLLHRTL